MSLPKVRDNRGEESQLDVIASRQAAGAYLRNLRERRGLTQRNLAELVGIKYYTFIAQVEKGIGRIPPNRYRVWASALNVDHRMFVRDLFHFYDPITYNLLFGGVELGVAPEYRNEAFEPQGDAQRDGQRDFNSVLPRTMSRDIT